MQANLAPNRTGLLLCFALACGTEAALAFPADAPGSPGRATSAADAPIPPLFVDLPLGYLLMAGLMLASFVPARAWFARLRHAIGTTDEPLQDLRDHPDRLAAFVALSPAPLALFDTRMRYITASQRWLEDHQLADVDAVIGREHHELFPRLPASWHDMHRRALEGRPARRNPERLEHLDGRVQWVRWEARPWHTERGALGGLLVSAEDITRSTRAEQQLAELAYYDPLTGLPNRRQTLERLRHALNTSARNARCGAIMLLDLDNFKLPNDSRGHDTGDALLMVVAERLGTALRNVDFAARVGGDEFMVVLEDLGGESLRAARIAEAVAEKLRQAIAEPIAVDGDVHHVRASIGITLFRGRNEEVGILLKQVELALYKAKDAGRDAVRFYNNAMQHAVDARAQVEAGLHRALAHGELRLHYQPQADATGRLVGSEALLRWYPHDGVAVPTQRLIAIAEHSGQIIPIGRWVLETACRQLVQWCRHPETRDLVMAVNVSPRQFHQRDFVDHLRKTLADTGAPPERLKLELTESLLLHDEDRVIDTISRVRALGVRFAIDDFGTGYSSLSYLKRLPVDELKIDRAFVRDIASDKDDLAIVQAIIALGRSLSMQVIAEGVETPTQMDILRHNGCLRFQGDLIGRPQAALDLNIPHPAC